MSIECLLCSQYGAPTHPGGGRVDSRNVQIAFQDFLPTSEMIQLSTLPFSMGLLPFYLTKNTIALVTSQVPERWSHRPSTSHISPSITLCT